MVALLILSIFLFICGCIEHAENKKLKKENEYLKEDNKVILEINAKLGKQVIEKSMELQLIKTKKPQIYSDGKPLSPFVRFGFTNNKN